MLKKGNYNFPVLYSVYMCGSFLSCFTLGIVVFANRLDENMKRSKNNHVYHTCAQVSMIFNLLVFLLFIVMLAVSWIALREDEAGDLLSLFLQNNLRLKENEYGLKIGAVISATIATLLSLIFFATVTCFGHGVESGQRLPNFRTKSFEFVSSFFVLSFLLQNTMYGFMQDICDHTLQGFDECSFENYASRTQWQDFWQRYRVVLLYVASFSIPDIILLAFTNILSNSRIHLLPRIVLFLFEFISHHYTWKIYRVVLTWLFYFEILGRTYSCFYWLNLINAVIIGSILLLDMGYGLYEAIFKKAADTQTAKKKDNIQAVNPTSTALFIGTKQKIKKFNPEKLKKI